MSSHEHRVGTGSLTLLPPPSGQDWEGGRSMQGRFPVFVRGRGQLSAMRV